LRQSSVAKQRVSAHFDQSKRTTDFIFSTSFTTPVKFLTEQGVTRGGKNFPSRYFHLHKKNPPSEKIEIWNHNQKNPKSLMAHLRMLCLREPGRRL